MRHHSFAQMLIITPINVTMTRSRDYTPRARPQGHRTDPGRLLFLRTLGPGGAGEHTGHCNVQMETGPSLE